MVEEDGNASSPPNESGDDDTEDKDESNINNNNNDTESKEDIVSQEGNGNKSVSKPKDPNRPKRKKARRACFACQRAHLTCGDERPCQRCVKRGLQDQCRDGMRKKAKYLHDAPNEALMPGIVDPFSQANGSKTSTHAQTMTIPTASHTMAQPPFMTHPPPPAPPPTTYQPYPTHDTSQGQMAPAMQEPSGFVPYASHSSSMASHMNPPQPAPMSNMGSAFPPGAIAPANTQPYDTPMLDPNDLSMYNIDLAGMNFGNHYGALEFGILSQMSMGTNDGTMKAPDRPQSSSANYDAVGMGSGAFGDSPAAYAFPRNSVTGLEWRQTAQPSPGPGIHMYNPNNLYQVAQQGPNAYAIGTNPIGSFSAASPGSSAGQNYDHSLDAMTNVAPSQQQHLAPPDRPEQAAPKTPPYREVALSDLISQEVQQLPSAPKRKRRRDPSTIYKSITKPYPYTAAFHALTAVLQRRFSSYKRLRIARAMASIRPSLISLQRTLIERDLVLMETCFQRQLFEIEDIASACGTPTLAIRRTGEVAYVGKEFTLLTGWPKDVLLGRAPNFNVNMRYAAGSDPASGQTSRGATVPPQPEGNNQQKAQQSGLEQKDQQQSALSSSYSGRPQPVFLAELLDDDSAIQWFEDFARLAFADSKGVASSPCKLLRYKTKDQPMIEPSPEEDEKSQSLQHMSNDQRPSGAGMIKHESNSQTIPHPGFVERKQSSDTRPTMGMEKMAKLGAKEGKIGCMYCWQVKRDVFDVPMMIVLNFLPIV